MAARHPRCSFVNPRAARALVVALFSFKVLLMGWNVWAFHPFFGYDFAHHQERVLDGGIVPRQRAYDGPLYYMPVLPELWLGEQRVYPLMRSLQALNVLYISAFYAIWLFWLFPRILPRWTNTTVASIVLLAIPSFQRLAACVHPDNLFVLLSSTCFAVWLWLERRAWVGWTGSLALALLIGLTGLSRPFSIVPVGIFTILLLLGQLRPWLGRRSVLRAVAALGVAGAVAGCWWATRFIALEKPTNVYLKTHDAWQRKRAGFDYLHFYTSFYVRELTDTPSRRINDGFRGAPTRNPYANSFFTTLYSDLWGDHWLQFSETHASMQARAQPDSTRYSKEHQYSIVPHREEKRDAKSVALLAALPLTVLLVLRVLSGAWLVITRALHRRRITPALVASGVFFAGLALFVYWQVTAGLQPGKHSSIKAHYIAYILAFALVPAFMRVFRARWSFYLQLGLACAVYLAALPVAVVWP